MIQLGPDGPYVSVWMEDVTLGRPTRPRESDSNVGRSMALLRSQTHVCCFSQLLPRECRERGLTYAAPLVLSMSYAVDSGTRVNFQRRMGDFPIMVSAQSLL
jgi:DNA-directed RNA polymerase beta subunit